MGLFLYLPWSFDTFRIFFGMATYQTLMRLIEIKRRWKVKTYKDRKRIPGATAVAGKHLRKDGIRKKILKRVNNSAYNQRAAADKPSWTPRHESTFYHGNSYAK